MGLLSDAGIKATDATGGLLSKAGSAVADKFTDIKARNNTKKTIDACQNGKLRVPGLISNAFNAVDHTLNYATLGISGSIEDKIEDVVSGDSGSDHKALKEAKSEAKQEGKTLSVKDKTAIMSNSVNTDSYNTNKQAAQDAADAKADAKANKKTWHEKLFGDSSDSDSDSDEAESESTDSSDDFEI